MPKTATAPLTDGRLWRLLLARTHPDAGGSDELFVWAQGLRESLDAPFPRSCGRCKPADGQTAEEPERIPFGAGLDPTALTRRALSLVEELEFPYNALLRLLSNHDPSGALPQEHRGATYRQLARMAHEAGMSRQERQGWYRVAESVPLSQAHAQHILSRLKGSS
jgi:hypothetical protein